MTKDKLVGIIKDCIDVTYGPDGGSEYCNNDEAADRILAAIQQETDEAKERPTTNADMAENALLNRALELALQHSFDQGYLSCFEIECPKDSRDKDKCFNPKDYVCRRYAKAHFIKLARAKGRKGK